MPRIVGVDVPLERPVLIGLTAIFGIGRSTSAQLLEQAGIDPQTRVRDLTDDEVVRLRELIDRDVITEGDLRREVRQNIQRLIEIGCYRGIRHRPQPAGAWSAHAHECSHAARRPQDGGGAQAGSAAKVAGQERRRDMAGCVPPVHLRCAS